MPANSTVSVIREVVNERLYNYESHLTVQSAPGLMTDDPLFLIDTDNNHRLLDLMEVMPTAVASVSQDREAAVRRPCCESRAPVSCGSPETAGLPPSW